MNTNDYGKLLSRVCREHRQKKIDDITLAKQVEDINRKAKLQNICPNKVANDAMINEEAYEAEFKKEDELKNKQ